MHRAAPVTSATRRTGGRQGLEAERWPVDDGSLIYNAAMKPNSAQPDSLPVPDDIAFAHSRALAQRIAEEIAAAGGWLPFDRYMELALYAPALGYYSGGSVKFGRGPDDGSDFVTAPELSPLFAQVFARPVADVLDATGTRHVVEFGAGTGKFAAGLLRKLDTLGVGCARYTIVELSGELRERQRAILVQTAPELAACVEWVDAMPPRVDGVIVGNEVLDAMPVRLFARLGGLWHERGVAVADASRFVFADRPLAAAAVPAALASVPGQHDYVTETHDAAAAFVHTVCSVLCHGAAMFVDYGFPGAEYYHPQRSDGTLMCHYRHRAHGDPFLYPGLQDITAHVQFSAIGQAAHDAGAHLLGYTSQARFLVNAGMTDALAQLDPADPARFLPAANAVQKLLSEAEMGELFKVIAFRRGFDAALGAFERGDRSHML
ncbi:hypothetical protein DFQ30_009490 [Apophysomyces sp. BC1015]|nr:hypothetical protein DFQ30_009490 [Apophysomyces sp. BC1015]